MQFLLQMLAKRWFYVCFLTVLWQLFRDFGDTKVVKVPKSLMIT